MTTIKTKLTSDLVAKAVGLPQERQIPFHSLSSDSRTITPGACFIALRGENSDGHAFIPKALAAGATGIIHESSYTLPALAQTIGFPVDNTLEAYRKIAKAWRAEFSIPIAVVAGSAGKTTSKELLAAVLRGKWRNVLQTQASQNGFQGIPATLLNLQDRHEAAVIEVGIDEPAAMKQHLEIVRPTIGLLTSIGEEHLEKLIDLATVAREEGELFHFLSQTGGTLCINCDDKAVWEQADQYIGGERWYYSLNKETPAPKDRFIIGTILDGWLLVNFQGKITQYPNPLPGKHNALNTLGAICVGTALGLSTQEISEGLKSFQVPSGRSEIYYWRKGVRVFCDFYNANPLSVKASLALLEKIPENRPQPPRTWACLGDMLELGAKEEDLHRALAESLLKYQVDHVLLYGDRMKWLYQELKKLSFTGQLEHFSDLTAISELLKKSVGNEDKILIKGSRGMRMERIWESLQASP